MSPGLSLWSQRVSTERDVLSSQSRTGGSEMKTPGERTGQSNVSKIIQGSRDKLVLISGLSAARMNRGESNQFHLTFQRNRHSLHEARGGVRRGPESPDKHRGLLFCFIISPISQNIIFTRENTDSLSWLSALMIWSYQTPVRCWAPSAWTPPELLGLHVLHEFFSAAESHKKLFSWFEWKGNLKCLVRKMQSMQTLRISWLLQGD